METPWVTAFSLIDRCRSSGISRVSLFILGLSIGFWGATPVPGGFANGSGSSVAVTHCSSWACLGVAGMVIFLPEVFGVVGFVGMVVLRVGMMFFGGYCGVGARQADALTG
jgi:small basic protein